MKTKKALYNILAQISYELVATVCGLILPRLILGAFGSDYNGMISSITQFLQYISVLTLGVSGATRVALYKAKKKNDILAESAILRATELYMRKVAIAFLGYMVILAIVYPIIVKKYAFGWFDTASLVVIIGIGTFAEYMFGITYRTYLMASQSLYVYNILQIFVKIANTIISVILIKLNFSIQIVKLGSAVCFVASPIILNYYVRKKYKLVKNVEPDSSALEQRGEVMAHSIANIVHQYTDIFVLTLFTSPAIVSVYSVYTLVLGSLRKIQTVFTSGLEAAFGELWAKGEIQRFERNLSTLEFLMFSFCSVVFSCAAVLILPFIRIYTRGITDINYIIPSFAYLDVLSYALFSIRNPYLIAVQAAGKYKETRNGAIAEAGLNLGLSLVFVMKLGLIGVTIGTVAANLFRTVQYALYLHNNLLHRKFSCFLKRCIWLGANVAVILVVAATVPFVEIQNWKYWLMAGVFYGVLALTVTVVSAVVFYRSDLLASIHVLKKMLEKKGKAKKETNG